MSLETDKKTVAAIFPGQGAQYVGMAKDFIENFSTARLLFEEADEILKCSLSKIILQGPLEELTKTKNSQVAIYVTSMAIYSVAQELYNFQPKAYAGLSLGEYSALTAGQYLSFEQTLLLVRLRGELMNQACQARPGTMAIAIGLDCAQVEKLVKEINLPNDLWIANYNCPGQIVLSGSLKGIEQASLVAKEHGAKRFLPLNVHGAFHSGLMQPAQEKLAPLMLKSIKITLLNCPLLKFLLKKLAAYFSTYSITLFMLFMSEEKARKSITSRL